MAKLEVVYVPSNTQKAWHSTHAFQPNMTVSELLDGSGVFEAHPEAKGLSIGVFSKPIAPDAILKPGDRVELYRPLTCDPKEKRRHRVKKR